ncbi:SUMF1/EgtB/PvdO family nonheme iron enzyme [Leptolyngbya sp. AN03gr2]|uniref:SUMF1/EgtB/PvdO family nonheme iron enzyme n=1 Tax=unclassified Leptolyngbya TaxID=2650499 RepID=UPI003D31AA32
MSRSIKLFFSYSHRDEELRDQLAAHLATLQRKKVIESWHDRRIVAGAKWAQDIDDNLNLADIILLLISPDFLNSDYCSVTELNQAMERHNTGKACVIPVILRHADWHDEPFAALQALPKNAKPIVTWSDRDEAFLDVVRGIRGAVTALLNQRAETTTPETAPAEAESLDAQSIRETEAITTEIKQSGKGEEQYRDEVLFCLKQDGGEISDISRVILNGLQESLELPVDRATQIENEIARPFKIFRKAVIDLKIQAVTPEIQARLDRLQQTLKLSNEDAAAIVKSVLSAIAPPEPAIVVPSQPSLPTFSFEIITVNDRGKEIDRRPDQASYLREELAKGVFLNMVSIPGGTFWMGAAEGELEARDNEKPRHQVTIEPFYMGKFAVTQAQWTAISTLPKINRDLKPDPSNFKGVNRPVECVTWDDAIECCDRLSRKTGNQYRLPSEAEWEYACRAGTKTPFHFGETITPELVNYDGNQTYANAAKGTYRGQTIDVESFSLNAFGLYQMHGNVWEWCADSWHESYENAPADGRIWETESDQENAARVLRGGSWFNYPWLCRSAFRNVFRRGYSDYWIGFRLALSCPSTSNRQNLSVRD